MGRLSLANAIIHLGHHGDMGRHCHIDMIAREHVSLSLCLSVCMGHGPLLFVDIHLIRKPKGCSAVTESTRSRIRVGIL
jgi:hypothetical protein